MALVEEFLLKKFAMLHPETFFKRNSDKGAVIQFSYAQGMIYSKKYLTLWSTGPPFLYAGLIEYFYFIF